MNGIVSFQRGLPVDFQSDMTQHDNMD